MKIRMKTLAAGPKGTYYPGQERDVDDKTGAELCAAGSAVPIGEPGAKKETATDKSADRMEKRNAAKK